MTSGRALATGGVVAAIMTVDFGKTASDYAKNRAGFPREFFERLSMLGLAKPGQRALDLGTGTGTVARGLAHCGCTVTGLDKSPELLEQAKRLDADAGVTTHSVVGHAERTDFADHSFELVTAGQCWHWFDRPTVLQEVRRLLVPGGTLVIAHFDWLPLPGSAAEATEKLIRAHNPRCEVENPTWKLGAGTGLYPAWLPDLSAALFHHIETFSFDVDTPYTHEAWRGRTRASASIGASLTPEAVARFDRELEQVLASKFPNEPLEIPHRVWAVISKAPCNL
jgi:SAM-dependent methyltransferase